MNKYKVTWKLMVVAILVLCGLSVVGQTTSVTATITDSDSQTWNNGTWKATLYNAQYPNGPFYLDGIKLTSSQIQTSGVMNNTGVISTTLYDVINDITPGGTYYQFQLCPNASAPCAQPVGASPTGTSINLSSTLSANLAGPRFPATGANSYGYLDLEVSPIPVPGASYFNVIYKANRTWNGTVWQFSSASSATTVTPEQFGAVGNAGTYWDGTETATQTWGIGAGFNTTPGAPTVTTITNNDTVVSIFEVNQTWSAAPATGTNRINLAFSGGFRGIYVNDQVKATAGSVSAVTGTLSGSTFWNTSTISLAPIGNTAPTFVAESHNIASPVNNITATVPAGTADNDILILCTGTLIGASGFPVRIYTDPVISWVQGGGWVPLATSQNATNPELFHTCWYRVASSEPASYKIFANKSGNLSYEMLAYRGSSGLDGATSTLTSATATFHANDNICIANPNQGLAGEGCGTIIAVPSIHSAQLSFKIAKPSTTLQFATATSDQTAVQNAINACPSNGSCTLQLSARYGMTSAITLPANKVINIIGNGLSLPDSPASLVGGSTPVVHNNSGTGLFFLTQALNAAAITVNGTSNVTATVNSPTLYNFSILCGVGYQGDGCGPYPGLAILNQQGLIVKNVAVLNNQGTAGITLADIGTSGIAYDTNVSFDHLISWFNYGCGLAIGAQGETGYSGLTIENTGVYEADIEWNGGPGICNTDVSNDGMDIRASLIQWDNKQLSAFYTPSYEFDTQSLIAAEGYCYGCALVANYIEFGPSVHSFSAGYVRNTNHLSALNGDGQYSNNYLSGQGGGAAWIYAPLNFTSSTIGGCASINLLDNGREVFVSDAATACTASTTYVGSYAATTTGTWTNATNSITVASATGVAIGEVVTGTGLPANDFVTNVSGTTITTSQNATAGGSGTTINFGYRCKVRCTDGNTNWFKTGVTW